MSDDRPWDERVELKNGKEAIVRCTWMPGEEHVVARAQVIVEHPSPGDNHVVATIDGPMSQAEANKRGAEVANNWYDRGNG